MKSSSFLIKSMFLLGTVLLLTSCNKIDLPFSNDEQSVQEEQPKPPEQQTQDENDNTNQPEIDQKTGPSLDGTAMEVNGVLTVTNVDDTLVLVNKKRNLPSDYVPKNLVVPNIPFAFDGEDPKKQMQQVAATAVEELFAAAENAGLNLLGQSGYRSYERQNAIFAYNVKTQGEEEASKVSAHPGQSEHQTGLALDVTCPEVNLDLLEEFGQTKEGIWLKENAAQFGFIIRYPKNKVGITEYTYEPWHIRYVGKEIATDIMDKEITLEEYFQQ